MDWQQRQTAAMGEHAVEKLRVSRVAVIGLGGVGGAAAEGLVRAGVRHILLCDFDVFEPTNKNRQLFALDSTIGRKKTEVAAERLADINPDCSLTSLDMRVDAENVNRIFEWKPDYIIDAVDSVTAKLLLIELGKEAGVPVISSMGTGNRFDSCAFKIGTAAETAGCACPLARVMRRELSKRGLSDAKVLYSTEQPIKPAENIVASVSWVPPAAGYALCGYVIKQLIG